MDKRILAALCILALVAGGLWAWRNWHRPVVPSETQAVGQIAEGVEAVEKAETAIKRGRAIIRALPGEVERVEQTAIDAAVSADLAVLADRANSRIREWVRQHSTGNAIRSSDLGTGTVLPGGGGAGE